MVATPAQRRPAAFRPAAATPSSRCWSLKGPAAGQTSQTALPVSLPSVTSGPLALGLINLVAAGSCMAAEDLVSLGNPEKPIFALSPPEVALVMTPLIGYGIYNYARIKNPQLNFQDLLLIIAAVFLFGNIFSIVVFKTSFY